MNKALGYTRVSSIEQVDGYSLENQADAIKEFANRENIDLVKIYVEKGKSAKNTDRAELQKLLSYCSKNSNSVDHIIIFDLQRLARNLEDQLTIMSKLNRYNITLLSVKENNDNSPSGKCLRNILGVFNEYDNDIRREKSNAGMLKALEEGRWIFGVPFGYSYQKGNIKKKMLVPDNNRYIVQDLFHNASTGLYSTIELVEMYKGKIPRMSLKMLNRIIKNELYIGVINCKMLCQPVKGKHEPIIEEEIFLKAQKLYEKNMNTISYASDFPLNGFATHKGIRLSGCWAKGKTKKYRHYRTHKVKFNISANTAEDMFCDLLDSCSVKEETIELLLAVLEEYFKEQNTKSEIRIKQIEVELKKLHNKQEKLLEALISETIDDKLFKKKQYENKNLEIELIKERESLQPKEVNFDTKKDIIIQKMSFLSDTWRKMSNTDKQVFQRLLFPLGVEIEKSECRTLAKSLFLKALDTAKTCEKSIGMPLRRICKYSVVSIFLS